MVGPPTVAASLKVMGLTGIGSYRGDSIRTI